MKERMLQVLIVEDNAGDARLVREMFHEEPDSFNLTHLFRMQDAETVLATGRIDVALLDMGLPDGHGLETLRRALAVAPDVPMIVLTGLEDEALATQAMKEGAQDYLIKGQIESRALPRALRYAIDRRRLQAETNEIRTRQVQLEERDQAAKEIAIAYDQLNAVMNSTSDGILQIDHNWIVLYGNAKAVKSRVDFEIGKDFWGAFPAISSPAVEQQLRMAMQTRSEAEYETYYARHEQWYRVHAFPTLEGLSLFFRDVSKEKAMQEQLLLEQMLREKRIEALSHMAGGLAHEISNPLAIIHGRAADLLSLAEGAIPPSAIEVRKTCESILQTSERATKILRGLRGFAREGQKDPMELASIAQIVEQCMELQHARFEDNLIKVQLNIESDTPLLLCREIQVGQILTNLFNNAFDAIVQSKSAERWITLSVKPIAEGTNIEVTDSGPGVEDHFKAHLMEPFFTTKEMGMGMGVGLSLSRAIAQDHGGTLTLCEDSPHTRFRLFLPTQSTVN